MAAPSQWRAAVLAREASSLCGCRWGRRSLPGSRPPPESRRRESAHSLSIVVVEDNPDVAQALTIALEHAGHRVNRFADGPSALAGAARFKPEAILLDIGLPGIDGYELAARLRQKRSLQNTLFVALSGFKRAETAGKPRGDFDHYFVKPVDYEKLLAILDEHARAMEAVSKKPQTPKRRKSRRVLLVEDHAELAAVTAEVLRQEGLEVRIALSGREALEAASDFRPQLILCDLHLPDMPGEELVRELRANPGTERSRVAIVTALHESDVSMLRRRAKQMGVDRFVSKPLTVEKIRTLLRNSRSWRNDPVPGSVGGELRDGSEAQALHDLVLVKLDGSLRNLPISELRLWAHVPQPAGAAPLAGGG